MGYKKFGGKIFIWAKDIFGKIFTWAENIGGIFFILVYKIGGKIFILAEKTGGKLKIGGNYFWREKLAGNIFLAGKNWRENLLVQEYPASRIR